MIFKFFLLQTMLFEIQKFDEILVRIR